MPTPGAFHARFWAAKGGAPVVPSASGRPMYPEWQSTIQRSFTLSMAIWAVPGDVLYPVRLWLRRAWTAWVRFYRLKPWTLSGEQLAVLGYVQELVTSPLYAEAQREVRVCATTLQFTQPEHLVEYSRAIKSDLRQAQNTYRHLRAIQGLKLSHPELANPEAHLVTELAYHGFTVTGKDHAKHVTHVKKHVVHQTKRVVH